MLNILGNDILLFFQKINNLTFKDKMLLIILILICSYIVSVFLKKYNTLYSHLNKISNSEKVQPYNEFIMYSNKSCPHCKTAKREFKALMKELKHKKNYNTKCKIINKYSKDKRYKSISEYPTFKLYQIDGKKYSYTGKRTVKKFKHFIKSILQTDA